MLIVIAGCMFSGKSERLISLAMSYKVAGYNVLGFKPLQDIRYSQFNIYSHSGHSFPCYSVDKDDVAGIAKEIQNNGAKVIVIDEAQFFKPAELSNLIDDLIYHQGKIVIVAGLSQDSEGRPFGAMPYLLATADDIIHLKAVCATSKSIGTASRTFRKDTNDSSQILVGGSNIYEPRSFKEWLMR